MQFAKIYIDYYFRMFNSTLINVHNEMAASVTEVSSCILHL